MNYTNYMGELGLGFIGLLAFNNASFIMHVHVMCNKDTLK